MRGTPTDLNEHVLLEQSVCTSVYDLDEAGLPAGTYTCTWMSTSGTRRRYRLLLGWRLPTCSVVGRVASRDRVIAVWLALTEEWHGPDAAAHRELTGRPSDAFGPLTPGAGRCTIGPGHTLELITVCYR